MVMVVQKYTISVIYHQAKEIVIADTLSQAFITDKTNDPIIKEFEVNMLQILLIRAKLKQLKTS